MPKPSSKTPQRISKLLALHAKGASARELAEVIGVSHGTILTWLGDAGLQANGGRGAREDRKRTPPEGPSAAMASAQKKLAELDVAHPSEDIPTMLAGLHQELAEARAFARYHREGAKAGTSTMGDYDKSAVIAERLATKIAELTPRGEVDPANDPANLESAAEVRREIEALAEAVERTAVCSSCGKSPFGKTA